MTTREIEELMADLQAMHIDVLYAIRQLREFADKDRALDALDRVEDTMARLTKEQDHD